jgi:hypothetical protein
VNHPYNEERFLRAILPDAIREAQPFINRFHQRKAAEKAARASKRTWNRIVAFLLSHGPAGSTSIWKGINAAADPNMKPVKLPAVKMLLSRRVAELVKAGSQYSVPETITATHQKKQEPADVHITQKCYSAPTPLDTAPQPLTRNVHSKKLTADVRWYGSQRGVDVDSVATAVWNELTVLNENATRANFNTRMVAYIEDKSGYRDVETVKEVCNWYFLSIRNSIKLTRIGTTGAIKAIRVIVNATGELPSRRALGKFLGELGLQTHPPRSMREITRRFILDTIRATK